MEEVSVVNETQDSLEATSVTNGTDVVNEAAQMTQVTGAGTEDAPSREGAEMSEQETCAHDGTPQGHTKPADGAEDPVQQERRTWWSSLFGKKKSQTGEP